MLSANRYCECLSGRCGELATATVAGVHACEEHAAALRRITHLRLCSGCQRNYARKGGTCAECKRARRKARQAA